MVDGIQELAKALQTDAYEPSKTYSAEVSHIDTEGRVWVYVEGSTKETPTSTSSSEVKAGDFVNVEWRNNKLYIAGNISNPSAGIVTVRPSVNYVNDLIDKDITVNSINAATGYIEDLTADHITAEDIAADHATVGSLDANYANIHATNIDTATIQNEWVNKILVQTGLIAHEGTVFTLDAIQVNAANITAGTLDVNRLIVTVDGQKYLVNIDPITGTPSYQKLDGNIVEPRTITADKIVAGAITTNEITTSNLQGTSGWINLHDGTFFYGNGASFATATNAISWNGSKLQIKADEFLLSSGKTIQEEIEAVENWFYSVPPTTSNEPAVNWTNTNLKEQHLRDIYFDTTSGKSYRWSKDNDVYSWVEIQDVQLSALQGRVATAETQISQNSQAITLKANASDVYNKTSTDALLEVKANKDTLTSEINASADTVKINANRVEIDGTATFNAIKSKTDAAYDAKGAAQTAADGIEVGGRNLLRNQVTRTEPAQYHAYTIQTAVPFTDFKVGEKITIQLWDVVVDSASTGVRVYWGGGNIQLKHQILPDANGYISFTYTVTENHLAHADAANSFIRLYNNPSSHSGMNLTVGKWKLERGNKATDWTPAPEDVQAEIDAKKSIYTLTTNNTAGRTYAEILALAAEGAQNTFTVTESITGIKVGDTVRIKYLANNMGTGGTWVYIIGTVRTQPSTNAVAITAHGLDTTVIDGGHILTGTIDASKVNVSNLTVGAFGSAEQNKILNSEIEVGGRNYCASMVKNGDGTSSGITFTYLGDGEWHISGTSTAEGARGMYGICNFTDLGFGDTLTLSADREFPNYLRFYVNFCSASSTDSYGSQVYSAWGSNKVTFACDADKRVRWLGVYFKNNATIDFTFKVKLEKGNKATDWSPAPEDTAAIATNYITSIDSNNGIQVHAANNPTSNYAKINADGMEVYKGGNSVAFYGDTSRVGKSSTRHIEIKDGGLQVYQNASTVLAHLGYGSGNAESGTANAPYFTFGTRASNSAIGNYSVAEGYSVTASGVYSHAENDRAVASGKWSHAEGQTSEASGNISHAEGNSTASGGWAHSEGYKTIASGSASHAEGSNNTASGNGSHAEGLHCTASGTNSHASGSYTEAQGMDQFVIGSYNVADLTSAFIIGDGSASNARANSFKIAKDGGEIYSSRIGNVLWTGSLYMKDTQTATFTDGQKVSEQLTGIVLVWSAYASGAAQDYNWDYQFIPKWHVYANEGTGVEYVMTNNVITSNVVCKKYVYVYDDKIKGNANNDKTGTGYANNTKVLRAVIGV